mgnify:CR=1 FL=1
MKLVFLIFTAAVVVWLGAVMLYQTDRRPMITKLKPKLKALVDKIKPNGKVEK